MESAVSLQLPGSGKRDIDEQRAQEAKKRAEKMIAKGGLSDHDYKIVEAKLQRVFVRLSVKS